jgi:hypothetical protein
MAELSIRRWPVACSLSATLQKEIAITNLLPTAGHNLLQNNVGPNLGRHLRGMGDTEIGAGLSRTRTGPGL